jgi:hypothetical protein
MKKKELSAGLLYLGLHNQLIKKYGEGATITRKEFFIKIAHHYFIPQPLRPLVLKEMQKAKLVERVNRDKVKILPSDIDLDKDCNKLYSILEIY